MRPLPGPKRLARLRQKKHRERLRAFLVEGEAPLSESPIAPLAVFREGEDVRLLSSLTTPTGPVAVFPFVDTEPDGLLGLRDRVVLLDGVQDPGNVGTLIRTARAFDAAVALSPKTADLYNPKTVRASMGSLLLVPVARGVEPGPFLRLAAEGGFATVAAVPDGDETPEDAPLGRSVIVVGAEGEGVSEEALAACGHRVGIPSSAPSLNAAVAGSILLYDAYMRVLP